MEEYYNPYIYMIMVNVKGESERVWKPFYHSENAEAECKRLNEDYNPRMRFHVCGMVSGDKP